MRYIFLGQKGAGKSTLLNGLVGGCIFKSSSDGSLQQQKQQYQSGGIDYIKMPGFNDCNGLMTCVDQFEELISRKQEEEDECKIVFVTTPTGGEDGHIDPLDGVMLKIVLDVLSKNRIDRRGESSISYGIIINKVTESLRYNLNAQPSLWDEVRACLNDGHAPTAYIHLYNHVKALDDKKEDVVVLHNPSSAMRRFLDILPSVHLKSSSLADGEQGVPMDAVQDTTSIVSMLHNYTESFDELRNNANKVKEKLNNHGLQLGPQLTKIKEDQDRMFREVTKKKRKREEISNALMDDENVPYPFRMASKKSMRMSAGPSKHPWKLLQKYVHPLPPSYPLTPNTIACFYLRSANDVDLMGTLPTLEEVCHNVSTVCNEMDIEGYWEDDNPSATLVSKDGIEMVLNLHLVGVDHEAMIGGSLMKICDRKASKPKGCLPDALVIEAQRLCGNSISFHLIWKDILENIAKLRFKSMSSSASALPSTKGLHYNSLVEQKQATLRTHCREDDETTDTCSMTTMSKTHQSISAASGLNVAHAQHEPAVVFFDSIRQNLISVIQRSSLEPVILPQEYVDSIKTEETISRGYFGEAWLGIDKAMGASFAVKLIKPLVIEQAFASQLDSVEKTLHSEVRIMSRLSHPNIAPLYGYCIEGDNLRNACLLYELAGNGSLDKFWATDTNKNYLQRERLSDARTRARIGLEVATALRYLHEGLDGGSSSFHRDLKSANILLTTDFSARIIDCGLAKYVTENLGLFSSSGPTGTPGYTCPQYLMGEIQFSGACDIFSLGIVISELITGNLSCRGAMHYLIYKKRSQSANQLEKDADPCVDWGNGTCLKKLAKLALKCMRSSSDRRPAIGRVVKELQAIVNNFDADELTSSGPNSDDLRQCQICGERTNRCIQCFGEVMQHVHCHNCLQRALKRNINKFRFGSLTCLQEGCEMQLQDEHLANLVPSDLWEAYCIQRNYMGKILMGMEEGETKSQLMQDLLSQLSAGNGLPCPRLFILAEPDRLGETWRKPFKSSKGAASTELYLYFLCSRTLQPVGERCRIKVGHQMDWLKAVAPALKVSLTLMKSYSGLLVGREPMFDLEDIQNMENWAKEFLSAEDNDAIEKASNSGFMDMSAALRTTVGNSLSLVAEKAASSCIIWQQELVPVYDYEKKGSTYVLKECA